MPIDALKDSPLFHGLPEPDLRELVGIGERRSFAADKPVLRAGDPNGSIFVIVEGRVRVERAGVEDDLELATLEPGVTFGEMSAIEGSRANATVRTLEPTVVLELAAEPLQRLLEARPALAATFWRNVARELTGRLARTNALVEHYVDLNQVLTESPEYRGLLGGT